MKPYTLSLSAFALLTSFSLLGCSGGSGTGSTSTSTGTLSLNPKLANIDYSCGDISGTTDVNGNYNYNAGNTCSFTIGGKKFNAIPDVSLTIEKIAEQNNQSSEAIATFIIAKMSEKTGTAYDINNLPETFSLPDDIETGNVDFTSMDTVIADLSPTLQEKVEAVKFDIKKKFANKVNIKFEEIKTPTTLDKQSTQQVSTKVSINGEEQTIGYQTILKTGDSDNGEVFGLVKDYQDQPITFSDNSPYICNGTNDGVGSGLDYTSFINKNDKLFMISQFECQVGAMYMAELEQDSATGALSQKAGTLEFISQKDEFGGFVHCAGQTTPWQSHLGSEEYEPNAKSVENDANATTGLTGNKYYDETAKFWGNDGLKTSPYYYGWTPEVTIDASGTAHYTKHYSMGRMSHELSYVMPDKKTVYMSDDGTNVGLFMFVADTEEDLSSGTLYAAKWEQTSSNGAGAANLSWINLGHANNSEIREYLDTDNNIATNDAKVFSDIFETADVNSCPSTFTSINTTAGQECLKVKDGMEKAASRLETRRYAALKGATTEFRKEEGITFDKNSGKLFVAMSAVAYGMEDNQKKGVSETKYDIGGNNDIKLPYNPCGAIYALDVKTSTVKDNANTNIDSKFVVGNMYSIIEGSPATYDSTSIYAGNTCDVNGISNPDNVAFLDGSDILTIGEDTGAHKNNVVWSYNTKTEELTRTFTTPLDAETTSPFWYTDLKNGFGYLSVVTQHPMEDVSGATSAQKESAIGYVGPFKNLTHLEESNTISSMKKIATYNTNVEAGSEIVAFDKVTKKMFTTNGATNKIDVTPINEDGTLGTTTSIDLSPYGTAVQSVAVKNSKVAVAVASADKITTKGKVVIFDTDGTLQSQTTVGYLPDMVTFNEDGTKVLVANEGEPDASDGTYKDVAGSIGVITCASATSTDDATGYTEVTFESATLTDAADNTAVRLGGTPSNSAALDIEPEYITVSGNYAYVTLQENNAIAKVDISSDTPTLTLVKSLGAKDYSTENTIDIEEEGEVLMKNYSGLFGLYMPDSIASYVAGGKTYLVTANEGDGREYCSDTDPDCDNPVFIDEKKIKKLTLDSSISSEYANEDDLKVLIDMGDSDNDNSYEKLYTYGARSFTIWDDEANLVWDSGDEISKLVSKFEPTLFNHDDGDKDGRSGNKGAEPEALTIGSFNDKTYAFVGLERQSAIVVYDITNPKEGEFILYIDTKSENISPEGMRFISKEDSPTGNALLLVAFEVSGTTSVYEIK